MKKAQFFMTKEEYDNRFIVVDEYGHIENTQLFMNIIDTNHDTEGPEELALDIRPWNEDLTKCGPGITIPLDALHEFFHALEDVCETVIPDMFFEDEFDEDIEEGEG